MNLFARYKKLFLILLFLAFVVLIGYFIWRFFFQSISIEPVATSTPGISGNLPSAGLGNNTGNETGGTGILPGDIGSIGTGAPNPNEPSATALGGLTNTKLTVGAPIINPTLNSDGQVQYYNPIEGKFYRLDKNGKISLLSDKIFHDVKNVVWSKDQDKAIIEYPDGNKILYDFQTKKQVTLPQHWEDFSFSPDSNKIVAKSLGLDPENRWLMVANNDGSQAKAIEAIGTNDKTVYPDWSPNNQMVAMYTKGLDFDRQEVYFLGLNDENFKSTIVEGRGFEAQWSTEGDRLLYSAYHTRDNLNPRLWIVDSTSDTIGQNRQSLDLQTWASKCTFASNTEIYCAVPETLERGAGLFPELADKTKDNLYKIDLTTGTKKIIAVPNGTYNISQVIVSGSQDYLYFTDKTTGLMYQVRLK